LDGNAHSIGKHAHAKENRNGKLLTFFDNEPSYYHGDGVHTSTVDYVCIPADLLGKAKETSNWDRNKIVVALECGTCAEPIWKYITDIIDIAADTFKLKPGKTRDWVRSEDYQQLLDKRRELRVGSFDWDHFDQFAVDGKLVIAACQVCQSNRSEDITSPCKHSANPWLRQFDLDVESKAIDLRYTSQTLLGADVMRTWHVVKLLINLHFSKATVDLLILVANLLKTLHDAKACMFARSRASLSLESKEFPNIFRLRGWYTSQTLVA